MKFKASFYHAHGDGEIYQLGNGKFSDLLISHKDANELRTHLAS